MQPSRPRGIPTPLRRPFAALASAALLITLAPAASGAPAEPSAPPSSGADRGPVGWETYRDLGRMQELRTPGQIRQSSSYDRTGSNDDGFEGTYSCLRTSSEGCVIAESEGAGEIQSIWFTRISHDTAGDVSDTGNIHIELDGDTVLDAPLQEVVSGEHGAPFSWPLVSNGDDTAGGAVIKVPMPYRESMRVTVTHNPLFHHVTYRSFADAEGVTRFDPDDQALDVLEQQRMFGIADPKPALPDAATERAELDVPAGKSATLARLNGPGSISQLRLRLPQVLRSPGLRDDGRAFGPDGHSTFQVAVDPDNSGVRLTRRYDPLIGEQTSRVLVDGEPAGQWKGGPSQGSGRWADQTLQVPAELTRGKERITVTHEFVSSDRDVNEFRYDVASRVDGDWTRTDVLDLGPGHPGEERAHQYSVTEETWTGTRTNRYPLEEKEERQLADSDALLADARLRITFDGERTVDAPLGEFFGSGLGEYDVRSLMFSMDTAPDGWYTSWWPMPYAKRAVVELVNGADQPISGATAEVTHAPDPSLGSRLTAGGDLGYFRATARDGKTVYGRDWNLMETSGRGVYYGATHSMRGLIESGNRRNYLEGDERVYVDGELSPSMYGTGTEDYYESGWYFRDGTTFSLPMIGNPAYEKDGDGCAHDCTGAYRLQIGDAVSFGSELKFGIEPGPASNEPAHYSATAYWYGQPSIATRHSDAVTVTDPDSRRDHDYQAGKESTEDLTSTFEGNDDVVRYRAPVTRAGGEVSFTLAVDPRNSGVRLTRLADQAESYQRVAVTVDGEAAGTWLTTLGNRSSRWLHDGHPLPASLTAGKSTIRVTLTPAEGAPDWSAARYTAVSHVPPYRDTTAPSKVTGTQAFGDRTNAIDVQWNPADDDSGAVSYQVYGSRQPSVPMRPDTLLGETRHVAFRHEGLGLREDWYYRVRAVDGSGNEGRLSESVTGTSGNSLEPEAESLLPAVEADAPVEAQSNCCGVEWSGGAHLWFRATEVGQRATVEFTVPEGGDWDLATVHTKAPDYGDVTLAIDDEQVGEEFAGYDPKVVTTDWVERGRVSLAAGKHRLTLTVTGKSAESTGYLVGLDRLRLTRAD